MTQEDQIEELTHLAMLALHVNEGHAICANIYGLHLCALPSQLRLVCLHEASMYNNYYDTGRPNRGIDPSS